MTADLSTTYLGLRLANPLLASSSPMTGSVDSLVALQRAGVGAVVLPSLWEEQIEHEAMEMQRLYEVTADSFAESLSGYFPEYQDYATRTESYLEHLVAAKEALEIPVIASLNGTTRGGWTHYAKKIEESGADALELNVYLIPTDPYATGRDVEERYLDLVRAVRNEVSIPLAVKIGPFFSSLPHMARELMDAGANGLVLFNRFFQPDPSTPLSVGHLTSSPALTMDDPEMYRLEVRCGETEMSAAALLFKFSCVAGNERKIDRRR